MISGVVMHSEARKHRKVNYFVSYETSEEIRGAARKIDSREIFNNPVLELVGIYPRSGLVQEAS